MANSSSNTLNFNYEKAMKSTIPAVRAAVAGDLKRKHKMSETEIARKLGIAQAAVSKYLSGNYSPKIGKLARFAASKHLQEGVVRAILAKNGMEEVMNQIDKAASDRQLVRKALE
jgi:predicted transcriptional regulator